MGGTEAHMSEAEAMLRVIVSIAIAVVALIYAGVNLAKGWRAIYLIENPFKRGSRLFRGMTPQEHFDDQRRGKMERHP